MIKEIAQRSQNCCPVPTFPKLLFYKEFHFLITIKGRESLFTHNTNVQVTVHHESNVNRETNKMQQIGCLLSIVYLNTFRALLYPSSAEQGCELPHMVFNTTIAEHICGSSQSCFSDDGHNSALKMLR
jgi:hypothetical protein